MIMDASEDKNPGDVIGVTPLHMAAANAHIEIMKCIMDTQEEKNPADINGYTPLHYVTNPEFVNPQWTVKDPEERKRRFQAVKLIFHNVAWRPWRLDDRNPAAKDGVTPLHNALTADIELTEIVELILNNVTNKNPGLGTKTHFFL